MLNRMEGDFFVFSNSTLACRLVRKDK